MSEPYISQILMVGFSFPPKNFAQCDGQLLPIAQNQALFSLLGDTYGGDGRSSFSLPELRGRTPIQFGDGYNMGQRKGVEAVALTRAEMATHSHELLATTDNTNAVVVGTDRSFAPALINTYTAAAALTPLNSVGQSGLTGSDQPHNNMQPFLAINFIIALAGAYPSRT